MDNYIAEVEATFPYNAMKSCCIRHPLVSSEAYFA